MDRSKVTYFSSFTLLIIAFIFHLTAMGHHRWKRATSRDLFTNQLVTTSIGLFNRCYRIENQSGERCELNVFPMNQTCFQRVDCLSRECHCDFLPSTKGIAACTILAAIFLGISLICLFVQSIITPKQRFSSLCLGFTPWFLLLFATIWILIALILVGSYLARDVIYFVRYEPGFNLEVLRQRVNEIYQVRVDWSTGMEIITLVFTFFSWIVYSVFLFIMSRN